MPCHTQILQLFTIFRFFLWFRYTNVIDWSTSFVSPITLSMFFTMRVWLRFHASKPGANMKPLKKFNFSFSSTLIKIIMCLSCNRVVVAAVYQRSFNLIHYFFQNMSLTLNHVWNRYPSLTTTDHINALCEIRTTTK